MDPEEYEARKVKDNNLHDSSMCRMIPSIVLFLMMHFFSCAEEVVPGCPEHPLCPQCLHPWHTGGNNHRLDLLCKNKSVEDNQVYLA